MRHYERLAEQDRLSRRTIVDALEVLRQLVGYTDDDRAVIRIGPLSLPSGELVGLVDILFEAASQAKICVVSLPTASQFMALRPGRLRRDRFDIARLEGAAVDGAGKVVLADGRRLRAVEVMPAHLPLEPSELDWRIVHHMILLIGAEERCTRYLADGLPSPFREMVGYLKVMKPLPDPHWVRVSIVRALDCTTLSGLTVPPLKVIKRYIADKDPTLKTLSPQKIVDALSKFGIRVPMPRPRVTIRHVAAAI